MRHGHAGRLTICLFGGIQPKPMLNIVSRDPDRNIIAGAGKLGGRLSNVQ
jgi:hypothetical protein